LDNVFIKHVPQRIEDEGAYVKAYESICHGRFSNGECVDGYNRNRRNSSLAEQTPDAACVAMPFANESAA
jgi:hypothetical protein